MSGAWRDSLTVYLRRRVFVLLPLGFSAGLPLLLVFGTLTLYLREAGVERATIGYLSWIGILFSFKVFWSPLVDHLNLGALTRRLGHRRSWMLLAQLGIAASLIGLALSDPAVSLQTIVWFALLTTFFSATQDICIDAFRIESVEEDEQGAAAAMYQAGYRLGMLVAGAGALYLAEFYGWRTAYIGMAGCALIGVATTVLLARELARRQQGDASDTSDAPTAGGAIDPLAWLRRALFDPFASFFRRHGRIALAILALIGFYRLSDISLGIMANVFYLDTGFSKTEIADITKIYGVLMTLLGAYLGGTLVSRYGAAQLLAPAATGVLVTNLGFLLLTQSGADLAVLTLVISLDNLIAGVTASVFIAYLSGLTERTYTATQYALFSSLMTLPGKLIGGFSGEVVDAAGYEVFFIYCALLGLPAIALSIWLHRRRLRHGDETPDALETLSDPARNSAPDAPPGRP